MLKRSLQITFCLATSLSAACFSNLPEATAVTVHAQLVGLPPSYTGLAYLDVAMGNLGETMPPQQSSPLVGIPMIPLSENAVVGGEAHFDLQSTGGWGVTRNASPYLGRLRFFRLRVRLPTTGVEYHPTGYDLLWSAEAVTFFPQGSGHPGVALPKGYSWLRRQCGPDPGQIQMERRPIEETLVFQPVDPGSADGGNAADPMAMEDSERRFVESCGAVLPAEDLGTRVSFDRTEVQPLVWSTDGARLFYLSQADASDPSSTMRLRQVGLSDGLGSEIVTVKAGSNLQATPSGDLYVASGNQLFRVTSPANGPHALAPLPIGRDGAVSPDGRWIVGYGLNGGIQHLWDAATEADVAELGGYFVGWSPDSRAATLSDTGEVNVVSPLHPNSPMAFPFRGRLNLGDQTAWSPQGPILLRRTETWYLSSTPNLIFPSLGLVSLNCADGTERKLLDPSVGQIVWPRTPPILDTFFVWATDCLGLNSTACTHSLIQITLTTGATRTMAVTHDQYPIGLSPDGKHLAFATPSGIYVKTVSP